MEDAGASCAWLTRSPANGRQLIAPIVQASQVTWMAESRPTSGFCRTRLIA